MTVFQQLIKHYSTPGHAPYSVKELLALHGRDWLKDSDQVCEFENSFCICRDGVVRLRYSLYGKSDQV